MTDNRFPPTPGLLVALDRMNKAYKAREIQQRHDAARARLNAAAPAMLAAARNLLNAYGGDVPDWLRPEWHALAKACADAEGFPHAPNETQPEPETCPHCGEERTLGPVSTTWTCGGRNAFVGGEG